MARGHLRHFDVVVVKLTLDDRDQLGGSRNRWPQHLAHECERCNEAPSTLLSEISCAAKGFYRTVPSWRTAVQVLPYDNLSRLPPQRPDDNASGRASCASCTAWRLARRGARSAVAFTSHCPSFSWFRSHCFALAWRFAIDESTRSSSPGHLQQSPRRRRRGRFTVLVHRSSSSAKPPAFSRQANLRGRYPRLEPRKNTTP